MKKIAFFLLFWVCINQAFAQNNDFPINVKAKITQAKANASALQMLYHAEMLNQKQEVLAQNSTKAAVFHMDSMYNDWDGSNSFSVFHYDSLNRLEKEDYYIIIGPGNKFHYAVIDLQYNANSKLVKKAFCALNFTSFLFDDTMMYIDYIYDINNYLTEEFWYDKDDSTGLLFLEGKFEYAYDGNGNISVITISDWDTSGTNWVNNQKYTYTYNASSKILEYVEQDWDTLSNTWKNESKHENIYDVQGNKTENIEYRYTGTAWVNAYKEAFTHNLQNQLTEQNRHNWDTLTSTWLPSKNKYTFQYNINGSVTESQQFRWIDSTSTWDTTYRSIHTRNENYTAQDIILPYHSYFFGYYYESAMFLHPYHDRNLMNYLFNDMLLHDETKRWMPNDTLWKTIDEFIYYYSDHTANIKTEEKTNIRVFPNPATDWLSFKINDNERVLRFSLFDISGRKIMDVQPTTSTISLENINSGMYLYRIETEEGFFSGKISVIR
jgi:hypothetical protein